MTTLTQVRLRWPSVLSLTDGAAPRSWIQLAKTGTFVSKRYGEFSITKDDLAQMLKNFNEVTPKAPTELPIDWDHLSIDPKKPGDGAAAGWMKQLQLRDGGDTLWGEIAWTPKAADAIKNHEYRFVSPSFVKDYTYKDGTNIGTTLLAAAITNHPFLEQMAALTLYSCSAMGEIALQFDLAEVGQRVMIAPGHAHTQDEVGGTFEITQVVGAGDEAFVALKDANGVIHQWFQATELLPASATPAQPAPPNLVQPPATSTTTREEPQQMSATKNAEQRIMARAQQLASERRLELSAALKQAAAEDPATAKAYLEGFDAAPVRAQVTAPPFVINLHRHPDEGFVELVGRVQRERQIDLRDAIRVVSMAYPALADDYVGRG